MDEELKQFKRLKPHEYAASLGYGMDARETSKRETVLRRDGDKIYIRMDADGHYVFSSLRDEHDMARSWFRDAPARQDFRRGAQGFTDMDRNGAGHLEEAPLGNGNAVAAEYKAMKELGWHEYLEQERKLPGSVLFSPRSRGRIRVDTWPVPSFPMRMKPVCGGLRNF